ncbi:ORF143 ME53 [Cydia pomonella granulovirus]|uniref:ORF143 ME53 n=2 Tax=Cydia pomonella granulosis virus TaxID=28289 RepID=P87576_GVCPM|nr:ORF143 ME53 [Cydia pomonella granulovirus]AAK70803.1 ORF143 ME53 [Cydia pomonella granulovirus]AIU36789.1 ORF143 me53 [Cydia pomonella granulovirus]AIU37068.1 ORF143 me53 [Cydia pomonella granulovirus]AIU37210.1 ORF143 me53 [Cydia pomonella granulovirus]QGY99302.1 ME53 [Cydia pomonella granulovirus]
MQDFRTQFLSKETEEVMFALVGLAQKLHSGLDTTPCYACNQQFKHIKNTNPFIFVVIKNYLNEMDDTLKYCCLKCWQHSRGVMDIIELYPTLKLCDVKKLMYNGVLRKFFFNFVDNTTVLYKKYAIVDSVDSVLEQMLQEKRYNDEIQMVRLVRNNNEFVAEESVAHLRMEYGRQHNFDRPLQLNAQLIAAVNKHCQLAKYHLEVYYKEYEKYSPFVVCYNVKEDKECVYCEGKIMPDTGHPVFSCSVCGPTNPNYFTKRHTMMFPFWTYSYDYNKVYWKTLKRKGLLRCDVMLYGVDARRSV